MRFVEVQYRPPPQAAKVADEEANIGPKTSEGVLRRIRIPETASQKKSGELWKQEMEDIELTPVRRASGKKLQGDAPSLA